MNTKPEVSSDTQNMKTSNEIKLEQKKATKSLLKTLNEKQALR